MKFKHIQHYLYNILKFTLPKINNISTRYRKGAIREQIDGVVVTDNYIKKNKALIRQVKHEIDANNEQLPHEHSKIIWTCWFQGLDTAPELIKACHRSLTNIVDQGYSIILITDANYKEYCDLPEYIVKKYEAGKITKTHFSDLLRLELLNKYGGTWIDATILCTGKLPTYMLNSDLFMFQTVLWETGEVAFRTENYFISACQNNKILLMAQKLLYDYWKQHDKMHFYLFLYVLIEVAIENYKSEWKKVIPFPRTNTYLLLERLYEHYDEAMFNNIINITPIHKLTYKKYDYTLYFGENNADFSNYDYIINNY